MFLNKILKFNNNKKININKIYKNYLSFDNVIPKNLDNIVKINLLENENKEKIIDIWDKYHNDHLKVINEKIEKEKDNNNDNIDMNILENDKPIMAGYLDKSAYLEFKERVELSPLYIYPILKADNKGFITMFCEYQKEQNAFIISSLEEYKHSPQLANPWLSIVFYEHFIDSKDLVLIRGDWCPYLKRYECEKLMDDLIIKHYLNDNYYNTFVKPFNDGNPNFDFMKAFPETANIEAKQQ